MHTKHQVCSPLIISLLLALIASPASAQGPSQGVINIGLGQQGDEQVVKPARGNSQAQVISSFGQPLSKQGPTGKPPIEVWRYQAFSVYFEGDYVIHSVAVHKPQNNTQNNNSQHSNTP